MYPLFSHLACSLLMGAFFNWSATWHENSILPLCWIKLAILLAANLNWLQHLVLLSSQVTLPRIMKIPVLGAPPNDKSNTGFEKWVTFIDPNNSWGLICASHFIVMVDSWYLFEIILFGTNSTEHNSPFDSGAHDIKLNFSKSPKQIKFNNLNIISWLNIFSFDNHLKGKTSNKLMIFNI